MCKKLYGTQKAHSVTGGEFWVTTEKGNNSYSYRDGSGGIKVDQKASRITVLINDQRACALPLARDLRLNFQDVKYSNYEKSVNS